ncbi:U5 small nuclear ribonucleoprotein TSSC4 isoform X2 [Neocloeon triangulifer]|nr:U5 small nuclear ribonucleoprotein TSSC4 isoform X2 [Neocloeon triangulifer]
MPREFKIAGGDDEFNSRNRSVFDQLNSLSPSVRTSTSVSVDDFPERSHRRRSHETRHLRGQESLFKRPDPPPPRWHGGQRIADHQKNPHKWTRYSLGDVSSEDMSDRTNTSTALSFLNELRKRREQKEEDEMETDEPTQQVQFKRPARKQGAAKEAREASPEGKPEGPIFRGSKRVMPEYIVGQRSGQSSRRGDRKSQADGKSKKLKLDHLMMEDEDGDSD